MTPVFRAILSRLYLFFFFMLALNLSIQHVGAADPEVEGEVPLPTANEPTSEEHNLIVGTTSTDTFSFEDVYRIELSTDLPGKH